MTRRMTSRRVGLTAAFLAMAAGGTAACDATPADPYPDPVSAEPPPWTPRAAPASAATPSPRPSASRSPSRSPSPSPARPAEDVFYCGDADGEIVADDFCDEESADYDSTSYFLWHSNRYPQDLGPGYRLSGGSRIAVTDGRARMKAGLPATGFVGNGSVKTNVVGRSSSGGYSGLDDDGYGSGG